MFSINPFDPDGSWLVVSLSGIVVSATVAHHAFVPLLSLGLAVSGLLMSYLYVEKKQFVQMVEGVKRLTFKISRKNFFIDDMYQLVLVKGALGLAKMSDLFDRLVIDRVVNLMALSQVLISQLLGWMDKYLIDELVNAITGLVRFLGERTRRIQDGNLQEYLTWALFGLLLIFYFLY